eukprot:TRINITY_DN42016_c0_g1_i1.p1 TRINITY_DN42016_c0_g1~~TRINITY_DN42016_c0_g1_i1.p1  ORF type:complete len:443 (-),score=57.68 TRINITY_DN42016_c0_g1_i1:366-1694(-)
MNCGDNFDELMGIASSETVWLQSEEKKREALKSLEASEGQQARCYMYPSLLCPSRDVAGLGSKQAVDDRNKRNKSPVEDSGHGHGRELRSILEENTSEEAPVSISPPQTSKGTRTNGQVPHTTPGYLEFDEVLELLREGDRSIKKSDVESLFEAMEKGFEMKVSLGEVDDFLHPAGGSFVGLMWRTGNRLRKAFDITSGQTVSFTEVERPRTARNLAEFKQNLSAFLKTDGWPRTLPGPTDYCSENDRFTSNHKQSPALSFGRATGHIDYGPTRPFSPGPATYDVINPASLTSGSRRAPAATMAHGPGHQPVGFPSVPEGFPSPADYSPDGKETSKASRPPSISIGSGPGHGFRFSWQYSEPSPASYTCKDAAKGNWTRSPAATLGMPWRDADSTQTVSGRRTPGPGTYEKTSSGKARISGGQFSTASRFSTPPLTPFQMRC